ncbi:YesL family protein [Lederbergia galactosidilytica]|uniref:DUF624 domain-containing protein n=2 Tax=Lederbergia galactosidilytica TaxID=217031 RepID=A0A177ZI27_9BACI|nr:DUF624 domain-containing protein [Lederbergia galactosidilytica]MBP1915499.1 putative membrane protein YesL [Lederbergia galactosidilytica]OAK67582.1 hypothetical protein ABB05_20910 [Lederbergia galactosidilytica]
MEHLSGIFKWLYGIGDGLAKMIYLHILWVLFTCLGIGVFGVIPATAALFSTIHKTIERNRDESIFQTFYSSYKSQFIKANGYGLIIIGTGLFLYWDVTISKQVIQSAILHMILLILCFFYFITVLYFFPVFARYELKGFQYIKQAFLIAISRPFETIAMILCLLILYYIFIFIPVLYVFMGVSMLAYPVMWFAMRAFNGIEEKKS